MLSLLIRAFDDHSERARPLAKPLAQLALLQSLGQGRAGRPASERFRQAVSSSSRPLTNRRACEIAQAPSPKARSTMRASPQMSRVMLKAPAWPLRSARITS